MVSAIGAASAQRSHEDAANGALPSPASASVAHLNVKGTEMVASLAASNSTIAAATRSLRSRRSAGQIKGHRPRMIASSEAPPSANTSRLNASVERGEDSILLPACTDGPQAQAVAPLSYRDFHDCKHPKREVPRRVIAGHSASKTRVNALMTRQSVLFARVTCFNVSTPCRGLTRPRPRATSFTHEHNQIDLRLLRLRPRQ